MAAVPEMHLTMVHGEDWRRVLTLTNADGSPTDLTGYAIEYAVAVDDATAPVFTASSDTPGSGVAVDAASGQVTLTRSATDVGTLTPGVYVHAVRATDPEDASHLVRTGTLTVVGSAF